MEELTESIRRHGVLQPLVVRKKGKFYELIAGERRLRAARAAGLKEVPILLVEADDDKAAELGLIENLQREDLGPLEEAMAFRRMMDEYHYTQESLSETLGKAVATWRILCVCCPWMKKKRTVWNRAPLHRPRTSIAFGKNR